jgi:hypothetical protein
MTEVHPIEDRDPWIPSDALRRLLQEAPADQGLLKDLADVRGAELDDPEAPDQR